jgi:hypothetical protein
MFSLYRSFEFPLRRSVSGFFETSHINKTHGYRIWRLPS